MHPVLDGPEPPPPHDTRANIEGGGLRRFTFRRFIVPTSFLFILAIPGPPEKQHLAHARGVGATRLTHLAPAKRKQRFTTPVCCQAAARSDERGGGEPSSLPERMRHCIRITTRIDLALSGVQGKHKFTGTFCCRAAAISKTDGVVNLPACQSVCVIV